ncbi:MAG: TetR/AcrR family transcriptional regulator [Lachnospiraceae bacterium]
METKNKIMASAFGLFATKGIHFSLSEVAQAVGIKKASIYAHFESKDLLIYNVIDQEIKEYFFKINQENDDLEKLFFGVLNYYNDSHVKLLFWKRLLLLPSESTNPILLEQIHHMSVERYTIVNTLIKRDMQLGLLKDQSDEEISLMFFSLLHGLLSSTMLYHSKDIKKHYASIWNIFYASIKL